MAFVLAHRNVLTPPSIRPSAKFAAVTREDDGKAGGISHVRRIA